MLASVPKSIPLLVLVAGLSAGTVDIGVAALIYSLRPVVILESIASGLIGDGAFRGGVAVVLLGLGLQWAMSILVATIYVAITALRPSVRRRWGRTGALAGFTNYVVMSYLVVPLSAAPFGPVFTLHGLFAGLTPYKLTINVLANVLFGVIIAFCVRSAAPPEAPPASS